jgi:hypothetical protein
MSSKFSKLISKITGKDFYKKQIRQGKKIKANTDTDEQHKMVTDGDDEIVAEEEAKEKKAKKKK